MEVRHYGDGGIIIAYSTDWVCMPKDLCNTTWSSEKLIYDNYCYPNWDYESDGSEEVIQKLWMALGIYIIFVYAAMIAVICMIVCCIRACMGLPPCCCG